MVDNRVINTMLGEAGYGPGRYADFLGIASVIDNRARATRTSPYDVVSAPRQFDAYGQHLPKGAAAYRDMAVRAWNQVQTQGPVHAGTFYATPSMTKNLPGGLQRVHATDAHQYFTDPKNRSINTALGYRQPQAITGAQRAISAQMTPQSTDIPTPTFAQRPSPTLSASLASNPVPASSIRSAAAVPAGLTSAAQRGARVGPSTAYGVPTPTARPGAGVPTPTSRPSYTAPAPQTQVATRAPDASRFGGYMPMQAPRATLDRYTETRPGYTGSRVAPQSVTAGLAPTPAQEANLRDRLGTFSAPVDVASMRRSVPTPTPNPMSVGSLLGVSSARAATPPQTTPGALRAPVSSAMLTASLTPGAVRSLSPRTDLAPSNRFSVPSQVTGRVPTPTAASRVPTPTSAPRTAPASLPQRIATPTARPQVAVSAIRTAPTVQRATPAPTQKAPAVAQDPWGDMRQVAQPASGPFGIGRGTVGRLAGAALGTAVAGPVGGLLGAVLGGSIANRTGTNAAMGGNGAGRGNQGNANGRSAGGGAFASGFGGFAERDSVVGPDGGKVGGSSRSSSGNAGRSGSSSSSGRSGSSGGGKSSGSSGGKGGKK